MTDVVSGVFSVICTALFLRFVWHPKTRFLLRSEREALAKAGKARATATTDSSEWKYPYTAGETIYAWMPWVILIACCALWGVPEFKKFLNNLFPSVKFSDDAARLAVRRHAVAAGVGHAGRCTTSCSACRRSRPSTPSRKRRDSRSTGCRPPAPACSSPRSCRDWCSS